MDVNQLLQDVVPFIESLPVIRAILGAIIVFFLPGFAWTLVLFRRLSIIERIALSFGLSIATVTLSIAVLHLLFGMKITGANSLVTIIVITVIALGIYLLRRLRYRQSKASDGD
jgi:uncharacterized membrane protein